MLEIVSKCKCTICGTNLRPVFARLDGELILNYEECPRCYTKYAVSDMTFREYIQTIAIRKGGM